MDILVIGNGFDLAHGLSTTYLDFLKFINNVNEYLKEKKQKAETDSILKKATLNIKEIFTYDYKIGEFSIKKHFIDVVKDNLWIDYFNKKCNTIGETWIDFEKEISNVVQILDTLNNDINKLYVREPNLAEVLNKYRCKPSEISNLLLNHLNGLIDALEIYLRCYISETKPNRISPDIRDLKIDAVISFNYTNTYNKLYGDENTVECYYIHGNINFNNEDNYVNNMVLGIDEYLEGEERNTKLEYVEFKKYFQRIYKSTGADYKKWLDKSYLDFNVYFFGHSLDKTDKDILKDIILRKNTKIFIYYHNKEAYAKLIKNLVNVIGQDKLIEMTGGLTPKIKFRLQKDMEKINKNI